MLDQPLLLTEPVPLDEPRLPEEAALLEEPTPSNEPAGLESPAPTDPAAAALPPEPEAVLDEPGGLPPPIERSVPPLRKGLLSTLPPDGRFSQ